MRTFKQAKADIWHKLQLMGWTMSATTIKVPHATSPSGRTRLWFKPQGIHWTRTSAYGTGTHAHALGNARSSHADIRTFDKAEDFIAGTRRYMLGQEEL